MEAVIRCMQRGGDADMAPLIPIVDDVEAIGGEAILLKVRCSSPPKQAQIHLFDPIITMRTTSFSNCS